MNVSTSLQTITEGKTSVFVYPQKKERKGPGVKTGFPFYNPAMELNRDVSVLLGQWFLSKRKKHLRFLDGLASSGIRGIRFANELEGDFEVTINDWSPLAYQLIQENIKKTGVKNATATNENIHVLLSQHKYHYVDIDPFGSPAPFIDSAVRGLYHDGILAATATDTATLCGLYPMVCIRRYGARPYHSPVMYETALRILVGFIGREAAKYDRGIRPLLCYKTDHYMRVYIQLKNSVSYANETIQQIQPVSSKLLEFTEVAEEKTIGPLWLGPLQHKQMIDELIGLLFRKTINTKKELLSLLNLLSDEANSPAFYYTTNGIASKLKRSPPSLKTVFSHLQMKGYQVTRTHMDPTGFKTNAPLSEIETIF